MALFIPTDRPLVDPRTGAIDFGWLSLFKTLSEGVTSLPWASIDFTGSNFNAISTRSASDLSSGTVPLARLSGITTSQLAGAAGVTFAQLASMTDVRLVGRSAGSSGVPQEITIGSGLSLSGGSLSAPTPAAAVGSVIQVVNATYATQTDSTSSTLADTGLTATITPATATNKILVIVFQNGCAKFTNNTQIELSLRRGASEIARMGSVAADTQTTATSDIGSIGATLLDSPASTSAQTYKTQFASRQNNATVRVQDNASVSSITLMEIVA